MKKILIYLFLIIFIPFFIVSFFIKDDNKKIIFKTNDIIETKIRVKRESGIIDEVSLEDYVVGVVSAEMPATFEIEALKAQSVAARTYVLKKVEQNKMEEYDILDTVMNQVYIDQEQMKEKWQNKFDEYFEKIKKAVDETKGEYLTYNGELIQVFFFSTSSGKTENSEDVFSESLPYLRSVDSTWDKDISPAFNGTITFTLQEFYFNLGLEYSNKLNIDITKRNETGSINEIKINGNLFKGTDFRKKLGLKSTNFEIEKNEDKVTIKTIGYGHGVGMSQYGANGMAKEGYKYEDILKHYFQGVEISKL